MTRDPVCNTQVDEETAAASSSYGGETYYFCSESCKQKFDQDSQKYAGRAA